MFVWVHENEFLANYVTLCPSFFCLPSVSLICAVEGVAKLVLVFVNWTFCIAILTPVIAVSIPEPVTVFCLCF